MPGALATAEAGQKTVEHGVSYGSVGMFVFGLQMASHRDRPSSTRRQRFLRSPYFLAMVRAHVWYTPHLFQVAGT